MQKPIAGQITQYVEKGGKLSTLLSSYTYTHMMISRWFRSKQRMHEAVVYKTFYSNITSLKLPENRLNPKYDAADLKKHSTI